ncbi:MAG: HAD hydrolase family protein [Bacteroidaceae bacterium]|nr:HAD hydrolase family protein [Bacteroidaceae bacterium]
MGIIVEDLSKIKALLFDIDGVLSANVVSIDDEGVPMRTVNIKDGYALHRAAQLGVNLGIISGGTCESVKLRYVKLGMKPENVILGASLKIRCYEDFKQRYGLLDEEILFVGDDIPDMEIMQVCGLPCCPKDAAPEVKAVAKYISPYNGGYGVGRDIVEQYLKAHGLWLHNAEAFGW